MPTPQIPLPAFLGRTYGIHLITSMPQSQMVTLQQYFTRPDPFQHRKYMTTYPSPTGYITYPMVEITSWKKATRELSLNLSIIEATVSNEEAKRIIVQENSKLKNLISQIILLKYL
jgi:hypothetical protein